LAARIAIEYHSLATRQSSKKKAKRRKRHRQALDVEHRAYADLVAHAGLEQRDVDDGQLVHLAERRPRPRRASQ
jgi:hypothetical protein